MHKYRILPIIATIALISACTTAPPTYKAPTPSAANAELSFESDFELHSFFSLNTEYGERCGKFESVGYLLKADSIFLYDKPNTALNVTVPSGKIIGVKGYHSFKDPSISSSCFPKDVFFTPLPGEKYVAKLNLIRQTADSKGKAMCFLSVEGIGGDGKRLALETTNTPRCNQ